MTRSSLRPTAGLVLTHLLLSLTALALLHAHRKDATTNAWVHGIIVAATAVLLMTFSLRALRGSAAAYLRLRISSAVLLVALIVVVALPDAFPDWMRALEAVSAICLFGVVATVNHRRVRDASKD